MTSYLAVIFSLSVTIIVLIFVQVVSTKYSLTRVINKLTLKPFYAVLCYIVGIIIQITIVSCTSENELNYKPYWNHICAIIAQTKTTLICYIVLIQLLEWHCLTCLMLFQAEEGNKNRLQVIQDQHLSKERTIAIIYLVYAISLSFTILTPPIFYSFKDYSKSQDYTEQWKLYRSFQFTAFSLMLI